MAPLRVLASLLLGAAASAAAQPIRGDHNHWTLLPKTSRPAEPVRLGNALYHLYTGGENQLAVKPRAVDEVELRRDVPREGNIAFHRAGEGDTLQLNEPFAIYLYARRAYLVAQGQTLRLVDYEPSREPPMPRPAGVHQWRFESAPEADVRDHRPTPILTRTELALFNIEKKEFLVYDRTRRTLRWLAR